MLEINTNDDDDKKDESALSDTFKAELLLLLITLKLVTKPTVSLYLT